jgi:hypothetical protein
MGRLPPLPAGVWVPGFVSLLMGISSEMVHSLRPLFLVGTLGVSVLAVGLIHGLGRGRAPERGGARGIHKVVRPAVPGRPR